MTGVQTCALPIYEKGEENEESSILQREKRVEHDVTNLWVNIKINDNNKNAFHFSPYHHLLNGYPMWQTECTTHKL